MAVLLPTPAAGPFETDGNVQFMATRINAIVNLALMLAKGRADIAGVMVHSAESSLMWFRVRNGDFAQVRAECQGAVDWFGALAAAETPEAFEAVMKAKDLQSRFELTAAPDDTRPPASSSEGAQHATE